MVQHKDNHGAAMLRKEGTILVKCLERKTNIKGLIRIRKSKMDRQYNDQKKKYKKTNNDLQITTQKTE